MPHISSDLSDIVITAVQQSTGKIINLSLSDLVSQISTQVTDVLEQRVVPVPPEPIPVVTPTEVEGVSDTRHNEEILNSTPSGPLSAENTGSVVMVNNAPPGSDPNVIIDFLPSTTSNFWELAVATPAAFDTQNISISATPPLCTCTLINRTGFPVQLSVQQQEGSIDDPQPPQFISYSAGDGEVIARFGQSTPSLLGNLTSTFIRTIRIGSNDTQVVYIGSVINTYRPIAI